MKDALFINIKEGEIQLTNFDKQGTAGLTKKLEGSGAGQFLQMLDKINKCNKHKNICLFNLKSVTGRKPKKVVFKSDEGHSTAYRIVLVSLKALAWSGAIQLSEL